MPELNHKPSNHSSNQRLIRAIRKESVDCTPVWVMRQAGRYLPEYRKVRERAGSFIKLCKTPELACEVTLQPLQRFDLDAAIIFSDILTIPDALGLGLEVIESQGPVFKKALRNTKDIRQLPVLDLDQLTYVYEAINLVQAELCGRIPLIGFCGSPWTLALYMLEGQSTPLFPKAMATLAEAPLVVHELLELLTQAITQHLIAQIEAGVQVVMLFDTWGGLLGSAERYEMVSLHYLKKIISNIQHYYSKNPIPIILFRRESANCLQQLAQSGCDVVGVDWTISLNEARADVGDRVALQGNMNPALLLEKPDIMVNAVTDIIHAYGPGSGHIFNLGHGITPDIAPEQIALMVETVHEFSRAYHQNTTALTGELCG